MHEPRPTQEARVHPSCARLSHSGQILGKTPRNAAVGDWLEAVAIVGHQDPEGRRTEPHRLFQYGVEHRGKITGVGVDDPQHFGGSGLLFEGLTRLGYEPRILHRDDRLRSEVLQERDLLFAEIPNFFAEDRQPANQFVMSTHWHNQDRANAS